MNSKMSELMEVGVFAILNSYNHERRENCEC